MVFGNFVITLNSLLRGLMFYTKSTNISILRINNEFTVLLEDKFEDYKELTEVLMRRRVQNRVAKRKFYVLEVTESE